VIYTATFPGVPKHSYPMAVNPAAPVFSLTFSKRQAQ